MRLERGYDVRFAIFPGNPAFNLFQRWKNTKTTLNLLVVPGKFFALVLSVDDIYNNIHLYIIIMSYAIYIIYTIYIYIKYNNISHGTRTTRGIE